MKTMINVGIPKLGLWKNKIIKNSPNLDILNNKHLILNFSSYMYQHRAGALYIEAILSNTKTYIDTYTQRLYFLAA